MFLKNLDIFSFFLDVRIFFFKDMFDIYIIYIFLYVYIYIYIYLFYEVSYEVVFYGEEGIDF